MYKAITTRLDEKTVKMIETTFDSNYNGVKVATESFFFLRSKMQNEIKGIFSENELKAIVDMFNATMFDPQLAQKMVLKAEIEDSEIYDGTLTKWDVSKDVILAKVDNMTEAQAFFIMFEAWNFWYSPEKTQPKDLDKFVKQYL